jgi:hypothetical protein
MARSMGWQTDSYTPVARFTLLVRVGMRKITNEQTVAKPAARIYTAKTVENKHKYTQAARPATSVAIRANCFVQASWFYKLVYMKPEASRKSFLLNAETTPMYWRALRIPARQSMPRYVG